MAPPALRRSTMQLIGRLSHATYLLGGRSSQINEASRHSFTNCRGRFLHSLQEYVGIVGIKKALELATAGLHTLRQHRRILTYRF